MENINTIEKNINNLKLENIDFFSSLEDLSKKYPYASSLKYFKIKELEKENNVNFYREQTKTLKSLNYKNYLRYLLSKNTTEEISSINKNTFDNKAITLQNLKEPISPFIENEEVKQTSRNEVTELIKKENTLISFNLNKKMSFHEWIKLSDGIQNTAEENRLVKEEIPSQSQIIEKFLEKNMKISAPKDDVVENFYEYKPLEYYTIMTETLAQIYIEQKKYNKAEEAYRTLNLKYPEKSTYFANQLTKIEQLKENNIQ